MNEKINNHYLFASTLFVSKQPYIVDTVLGSCIAVCLFDAKKKIGGINHYMLPFWNGEGLASPKYGNIAIARLIEKMLFIGADTSDLEAKIFGGANQIFNSSINIGERNFDIAKEILAEHNIKILAHNVGGQKGRKIRFDTNTGQVAMKFLNSSKS